MQWSDGNTDPIRTVVVAATNPDYIAYFTSSEAINEQYTRDVTTEVEILFFCTFLRRL